MYRRKYRPERQSRKKKTKRVTVQTIPREKWKGEQTEIKRENESERWRE